MCVCVCAVYLLHRFSIRSAGGVEDRLVLGKNVQFRCSVMFDFGSFVHYFVFGLLGYICLYCNRNVDMG